MSDVLAENLFGRLVMGSDGTELGMLYNITVDTHSGELHDLVVEPDEEVATRSVDFEQDDTGRFYIPIDRVRAVKDYIVVQR